MSELKTRTVLQMQFNRFDNKVKSIRISDPKPGLTPAVVEAAMTVIADLNPFLSLTNSSASVQPTPKGARTVQTVTSDFGISFD